MLVDGVDLVRLHDSPGLGVVQPGPPSVRKLQGEHAVGGALCRRERTLVAFEPRSRRKRQDAVDLRREVGEAAPRAGRARVVEEPGGRLVLGEEKVDRLPEGPPLTRGEIVLDGEAEDDPGELHPFTRREPALLGESPFEARPELVPPAALRSRVRPEVEPEIAGDELGGVQVLQRRLVDALGVERVGGTPPPAPVPTRCTS